MVFRGVSFGMVPLPSGFHLSSFGLEFSFTHFVVLSVSRKAIVSHHVTSVKCHHGQQWDASVFLLVSGCFFLMVMEDARRRTTLCGSTLRTSALPPWSAVGHLFVRIAMRSLPVNDIPPWLAVGQHGSVRSNPI